MNYTIRIKRQENPQASPCWQEFSFEGSADTSIASVLNELNHRSPLCEKKRAERSFSPLRGNAAA